MKKHVLVDIETERKFRLLALSDPDPRAPVLWNTALDSLMGEAEKQAMEEAYDFAKNVNYHHEGLKSDVYFSHPLRVASLSLLLDANTNVEAGILGILHNVLEVSDVSVETLEGKFGESISKQIKILTVDRPQQWDKEYKCQYYGAINNGPRAARVVKIVDKLDNLFLLGRNKDEDIREKYLLEIEKYVLPMAREVLLPVSVYLEDLVKNCRDIGYFDKPNIITERKVL